MAEIFKGEKRQIAAQLIALAECPYSEVAEKIGVTPQTIYNWRRDPDFLALVETCTAEMRAEIRRRGIAQIDRRVAALQDRWDRMKRVIEERAADPEMQMVPGGSTGLLVHNVKSVGVGADAERIDLYEVDTALLKEMREHEKQAAQELGQWEEKSDNKHHHDGNVQVTHDVRPMMAKLMSDPAAYENAKALAARMRSDDAVCRN